MWRTKFFHKLSFTVAWLRKMCICVLSKICSFIDREQTKGVFTNFKMKIRVRNRRTSLDPSRKSSVWRAGEEIPFRSLSHGRADTGSLSHRWATAESLLHKREYFNRRTSLSLSRKSFKRWAGAEIILKTRRLPEAFHINGLMQGASLIDELFQ